MRRPKTPATVFGFFAGATATGHGVDSVSEGFSRERTRKRLHCPSPELFGGGAGECYRARNAGVLKKKKISATPASALQRCVRASGPASGASGAHSELFVCCWKAEADADLCLTRGRTGPFKKKNKKRARRESATWLILPVVICLSQRLSHASLSTCQLNERRNREWLIKSVMVPWTE